MQNSKLEKVIGEKFCFHRGTPLRKFKENSIEAIRVASKQSAPFIEFDVMLADDGKVRIGHPPQEPAEELGDVLDLFDNKNFYPKIDIKQRALNRDTETTRLVLAKVKEKNLRFALITTDCSNKNRKDIMYYELAILNEIKNHPSIKLSIDLGKYKKKREAVDRGITEHLKKLYGSVHTLSAEVHESDPDEVGKFANEHGIKTINFWLKSWPDVINPRVSEETILSVLFLEKKYGVKIYFDMHRWYVTSNNSA